MIRCLRKALFRFHSSEGTFLGSEGAAMVMLCVYELQFASWFAGYARVSSIDRPVVYLLSLTNIFRTFGTTLKLAKLLLIAFTVIYAFIVGIDVFGIMKSMMKKSGSRSSMLQKLSATLFALQKHFLLMPALAASSSALGSSDLLWPKIVGGMLLALICIYNLTHSVFKVILPYSKNPLANLNSSEETKDFAIQVLAAGLSTNYVKRYFISTAELIDSGPVSLGISIPFLIICLLRTMRLMVYPIVNLRKYQTVHIIFSFTSVYVLVELILSGRGVAASFPTLIIGSLLVKVILNFRELILLELFNHLQRSCLKRNALVQNLTLRSLYTYFESIRDDPYDFAKIIQILLTEQESQEVFSKDQSEIGKVCEAKFKSDLRPKLIKFIERQYSLLIQERNPHDSFSARVARIQFLSEISGNKSKALQQLFELRHIYGKQLSIRNQVILKTIQESLTSEESQDKFHLRGVLDIQRSHQNHVNKAQELVSIRAEILARLLEPGCDLDILKKLSVDFTDKGEKLLKELQKILDSDCHHIETMALYEYIQICLYEMSHGYRSLKLEVEMSRMKAFNLRDLTEGHSQIPEKKVLMNLDASSRLSYATFSLSKTKFGEGIVFSKNFGALVGLPDDILASKIKIDTIFPNAFKEKFRNLVTNAFENGSNLEDMEWSKVFLQKMDGSLLEIKVLMTFEVMLNNELALVLYVYQVPTPLHGFLFNETLEPIGFSNFLLKSLSKAARIPGAEAATHLLRFSSIKQFLPTFDPNALNGDNCINFECEFEFFSGSKLSDSSKRNRSQKNYQVLLLSGTISKRSLQLFNAEYFAVTISQIASQSKKHSTITSRSQLLDLKKLTTDGTFTFTLDFQGENKTIPDSVPNDDFSHTQSPSRNGNSDFDTDGKNQLKVRNNQLSYSEKDSPHENFEHEESSQLSSSLLDSKRKRIKQMISGLSIPRFLVGINIFGHLSVLGLLIMIIVSYVILSQAYNQFSQFAEVAPFPSYLNSVVKGVFANVQQAIAVNNDYYPPSIEAYLKKSVTSSFQDRTRRFLAKFNQYMVNYNVEALSPNFQFKKFEISVGREGIYDTPRNVTVFEASSIYLGVIYKLTKTDFSKFTLDLSEAVWISSYNLPYLDVYEEMRSILYSDFNLRYLSILTLFDIILAIGTTVAVVIVVAFLVVWKLTEQRKSELMRQVLTIPHELIRDYFCMFQTEYKAFFGTDITVKNYQLPSQAKEKHGQRRKSRHATRLVYRNKEAKMPVIIILSLIPIVYVLAYYLSANIYFKQKTKQAIPYINNIDMLAKVAPYSGEAIGLTHQLINTYNSTEEKALIPTVEEYIGHFKGFRDSIVNMMQTASATLLATDYASDRLKERYANVSTILACDDIKTNPNYETCKTAFNGAAKNGFAGLLDKFYDYVSTLKQTFLANPTRETVLQLFNSSQVQERQAFAVAADALAVTQMEVEGENLAEIMQRFQQSLIVLLVLGIVMMTSLLFLIWRPIFRRITTQYLNCRRVYAVLPVYLISDNKQILRVLKLQNNSRYC